MLWLSFRLCTRGETSIDPYTIEIPLIFPRTKKIFFPYPILTAYPDYIYLSYYYVWYAYAGICWITITIATKRSYLDPRCTTRNI